MSFKLKGINLDVQERTAMLFGLPATLANVCYRSIFCFPHRIPDSFNSRMHSDRSAPEIGSLSCSNTLRKTHSTPQSNAVKAASSPSVNSRKKESLEDVVTKEIERKLSASPKSKKTFFDGFRASFRPRRSNEDDHNNLTLSVVS